MPQPNLLLSIKDRDLAKQIGNCAKDQGFDLHSPAEDSSWLQQLGDLKPDLVIAQVDDFTESDLNNLRDSSHFQSMETIFVSHGEPNPFVDAAMLSGVAFHFRLPLDMPFVEDLMKELVAEVESHSVKTQEVLTSQLDQFGMLLGSSKPMRKLYRIIRKAAATRASIFIIGESGAGKELVANTIHIMSDRRERPFVTLNCGAISPALIESELFGHVKGAFTGATGTRSGVFEQASGSTLFLDEITEMPLDQQVKLLRVLESGEFKKVGSDTLQKCDVRVIAATNREPAEVMEDEEFREDLYFRLAQFPLRVPPLREREGDILGLARHFLAYRNAEEKTSLKITEKALERIASHSWPGNVRELRHTIERAYILADDVITDDHIVIEDSSPTGHRGGATGGLSLELIEKEAILNTLRETNNSKKETAKVLGISVKTLYNKLDKYREEDESLE